MPHRTEFGEFVKVRMAELKLDYREVAPLVPMHYATLYDYARGNAPGRADKLPGLSRILQLSPEEEDRLYEMAGFAPPERSPADLLIDGVLERQQQNPELEIPFPELGCGARELTPERVREVLDAIDRRLSKGGYKKRTK
jgi:hypothetical protein